MRRIVALSLISLVAATPLAAQFEGTVSMRVSGQTNAQGMGEMNMKMAVKGNMSVTVMSMPAGAGQMAGMEMRSIRDGNANTVTTLMPMPAGMGAMPGMANAKGIKMVVDLSKMQNPGAQAAGSKGAVKKLGTSQTIIGMSCDDYEMTPASGQPMRMCMTSALGPFNYPQGGMGRRGGGAAAPAWATAFGNKPMFPLKVWSTDGKVAMEVTAIDKSPVPASMFEIPDGYVDMAAMMGGMRPPRR